MGLLFTLFDVGSVVDGERFLSGWNHPGHTIAFLLEALLPAHRQGPSLLQLRQWTDSPSTSTPPIAAHWMQFVQTVMPGRKALLVDVERCLTNSIAAVGCGYNDLPSQVATVGRGPAIGRPRNVEIGLYMESMVYWRMLDARCDPDSIDTEVWEAIAGAIVGLHDATDACARLTRTIREIVDPDNRDSIPVFRPWRTVA